MASYTTQLQAGTGMVDETNSLLSVWSDGMTISQLSKTALDEGVFPTMSARRVRNVVAECFAPRYLVQDGKPAIWIKELRSCVGRTELVQLLFVYTCRANEILADFVKQVYWNSYAAGKTEIIKDDATDFVVRSNQDGKTTKLWSDSTIRRVSSYLISCCSDFGLIDNSKSPARTILPFRVHRNVALFLSHELHFDGKGDNAVVSHSDWQLFGMEQADVIEQFRQLMLDGHLVVQSAGGVVNVGWKYQNMQEVIDAIGR